MNPALSHAPHHRLKFHWPKRVRVSLALVGFVLVSVLGHGIAFYILQVVDPPEVVIPPPPVQVSLLTDSTPENRALLDWIDANDPAAIANTHEIVPGTLHEFNYQRAPSEIHATPKSPEPRETAEQYPPSEDTMALIGGTQQSAAAPVAIIPAAPTELRFSGALAGRKVTKHPPIDFSTAAAVGRQPVSFMVGVGPDGKVLYTFFMGVAMDDAEKDIDRHAERYLGNIEFARQPGEIQWGVATYYWGDDSYQTGGTKP